MSPLASASGCRGDKYPSQPARVLGVGGSGLGVRVFSFSH